MLELIAALAGLAVLAVATAAHAAQPKVGDHLAPVVGNDLDAKKRDLGTLVGDEPTLVVAITERAAEKAMRAWFDKSDTLAPRMIRRVGIVSIDMPFFVSDGMARGEARGKTPKEFFGRMLLDTSATMAGKLGLKKSDAPYVFVVAKDRTILAAYHGEVDGPGAGEIWKHWPAR